MNKWLTETIISERHYSLLGSTGAASNLVAAPMSNTSGIQLHVRPKQMFSYKSDEEEAGRVSEEKKKKRKKKKKKRG